MRIRQGSLGLLVALMGVYLTLICPGHDHDGQHTAAHFTLLGEAEESRDEAGTAPDSPRYTFACAAVHAPGGVQAMISRQLSSPVTALQLMPATERPELDSLLILEIVPAAPTLDRPPLLRNLHLIDQLGGAQISLTPELPPPRSL